MCGITGWRSWKTRPDKATLRRMNDAIAHRGPDSDGYALDDNVGLAMRRLAIIDLSPKGNQPMNSSTGDSTIIFNGEIYNFHEIKAMPQIAKYRFKSGTDTEAIMALYESVGEQCVQHLRGMFAFALYDKKKKSLFIARDRLGKKPLYYYYQDGEFLFASEIKALLQHPALAKRRIDYQAVEYYLKFGYVPEPLSIFEEIKKLPPGHTLTLSKEGKLEIKQYWDLDFNSKTPISFDAASKELRQLFEESVRLRMIADVPLGAFLSGGIDSSAIVAAMAKQSDAPVKTFSVGFGEQRYNELDFARIVAEKYATEHHEIMLNPDFVKDIPMIMRFFDEPFADGSAIPTYYIAQATRKHVTVALNGDGGDENFAGYKRYVYGMRSRMLKFPRFSKTDVPRTGKTRMLELLGMTNQERYYAMHTMIDAPVNLDGFNKYYNQPKKLLDKWLYTDIKTYLSGDLLVKVDRATMANSLEGRSPLLDHKLMEFAASMPPEWKLQGGNTKIIFRHAVKDLLPPEILKKPKQGFAVPINEWMNGELGSYTQEELGKSALLTKLGVNWQKLVELQKQGKPHGYRLWNLLMLREWEKRYGVQ